MPASFARVSVALASFARVACTRPFAATLRVVADAVCHGQAAEAIEPADDVAAICTDRPTKSNAPSVVEPGHFQFETDLVSATRYDWAGARTNTLLVTYPTLNYGIAKDVDLELNVAPWVVVRSRDGSGATSTLRGVGDTYLRVKWNVLNNADGDRSAALLPYLKAPAARRGIGNRATEGGVLLPVSYKITDTESLTTVPELDALLDADGSGWHPEHRAARQPRHRAGAPRHAYGELWGNWNFDPAGTVRPYSADLAVGWAVSKLLQLDAGVNLGLNRNTPGAQACIGLSRKF